MYCIGPYSYVISRVYVSKYVVISLKNLNIYNNLGYYAVRK